MIKFGEQVDTCKKSNTDLSEKYKSIKPTENMSDSEVDDFWSNEFAKEKEDTELDVYDKLLSEIFNRSEDELTIDFNVDEVLQGILHKFSLENWQEMKDADKLSAIKELAQAVGEKLGLDKIPKIEIFDGENEPYGNFDPLLNVVNLNKQYFDDPKELVNTLTHELRHAYQNMRAEFFETWEDALFKCNFDNYISPVPLPGGGYLFFMDYQDQYVEVDARAFANKFMEVM
ncbi:hypothetical protein [Acetivibrio ethanolgignens]|uniref:Uncharacterized protein n=1 Tax=Acetivibrio ethanolgignens TaxID=290052 RepID=A0A0V8QIL0_9FIRM|nr:hypothetical protein [Acetivibrio ethanolgignens]KSV60385.1 hypothetical protein ASU35_05340 [Acetivibrio ethanolgignens]